jgi:hypothetical protein
MRNLLLRSPDSETGGTPTPTGGVTTPPADTIPLSRAEYDKLLKQSTESEALRLKLKSAEEDLGHVNTLLRPGSDPSASEASVRRLMARTGYSSAEIEDYIRSTRETPETPEPKGRGSQDDDEDESEAAQFVQQTRASLEELREATRRQDRNRLEGQMKEALNGTLDSRTDLGKLYKAISQSRDSEGQGETETANLRETLLSDVRRETLDRLRARRLQSGGAWRDEWINEEAAKAASAVYGKFKLLVPNPSRLGRTEDLTDEQAYVSQNKPVSAPVWKKGKSMDEVSKEAHDWAVDTLLRASVDAERGTRTESPL